MYLHRSLGHGLPCACGLSFPTPLHAALHLFTEETRHWSHDLAAGTSEPLTSFIRELRPTRSGGKPSTPYLTLKVSDIASDAALPSIRYADLPSTLPRFVFFKRHSGRKVTAEDCTTMQIR